MSNSVRTPPISSQFGKGPNNWYQSQFVSSSGSYGSWQEVPLGPRQPFDVVLGAYGESRSIHHGSWRKVSSEPSPSPPQPFEPDPGAHEDLCSANHGSWQGSPPEPLPQPSISAKEEERLRSLEGNVLNLVNTFNRLLEEFGKGGVNFSQFTPAMEPPPPPPPPAPDPYSGYPPMTTASPWAYHHVPQLGVNPNPNSLNSNFMGYQNPSQWNLSYVHDMSFQSSHTGSNPYQISYGSPLDPNQRNQDFQNPYVSMEDTSCGINPSVLNLGFNHLGIPAIQTSGYEHRNVPAYSQPVIAARGYPSHCHPANMGSFAYTNPLKEFQQQVSQEVSQRGVVAFQHEVPAQMCGSILVSKDSTAITSSDVSVSFEEKPELIEFMVSSTSCEETDLYLEEDDSPMEAASEPSVPTVDKENVAKLQFDGPPIGVVSNDKGNCTREQQEEGTIVHWAIYYGREKRMAALLTFGANTNIVVGSTTENLEGYTAVDVVSIGEYEAFALKTQTADMVWDPGTWNPNICKSNLSSEGHSFIIFFQHLNWGQCSSGENITVTPFITDNKVISFDNSCDYLQTSNVKVIITWDPGIHTLLILQLSNNSEHHDTSVFSIKSIEPTKRQPDWRQSSNSTFAKICHPKRVLEEFMITIWNPGIKEISSLTLGQGQI